MPTDSTPPDSSSQLKQTDVFIRGQDGTYVYRIPSVVVAPNGDLLAICEARRKTGAESDDIDLVLNSTGCCYERGEKHVSERLTFARFTLEWLTDALTSE